MNNAQISLKNFFTFQEKDLSQTGLSSIELSNTFTSLKERILKEAKEIRWPVTFNEIIKKVEDLLNVGINDIMVTAWNKYRILLKYTDKEKYSPNETFLVPLSEHTIKSEHKPYIEILINDKSVGKIDFNINISLTLKGIILKIRDGKIQEIQTGSCKGKGTIKCYDFVIMEKETESFSLPGSINLGEGVPIVP